MAWRSPPLSRCARLAPAAITAGLIGDVGKHGGKRSGISEPVARAAQTSRLSSSAGSRSPPPA